MDEKKEPTTADDKAKQANADEQPADQDSTDDEGRELSDDELEDIAGSARSPQG